MLFNSPLFILAFIPLFLIVYFAVPGIRLRNLVIVLFSVFFFAWGDPIFVWFVIGGTWIDYMIIKYVLVNARYSNEMKKSWVAIAILINVGALLFFKYANFFIDQVHPLMQLMGVAKPYWYGIALPLGISFIAFHKISFIVDLYKQRAEPPSSFSNALLYICFFPQLIAGPIIRYNDISQQISRRVHSSEDFLAGFFRFSRGLAKKAIIADPAGEIATTIFALSPESMPANYMWLGALAYSVQIYFDFSGYSDMAIGLGRIVGFRFPENFNQPYIAKSVTEFWQRWHISLSNWMRVYLYIPLGGNKVAPWRMYLNLWIVFLISGLWHGAAWNFIAWGAYYGLFLTLEKMGELKGWKVALPSITKQFVTFIVVLNAWVLFRADSLDYAMRMLGRMYGVVSQLQSTTEPFALIFPPHNLLVVLIGTILAIIPLPQILYRTSSARDSLKLDTLRWASSMTLFFLSLSAVLGSGSSTFLYFRF